MKNILLFLSLLVFTINCNSQEIPNKDEQISSAVMAAPEEYRADAAVLGYNANGTVVTLREGSNNQICLGDNPNQEGFSVACYHKDLEAFMARGRELKKEGKNRSEIFDIREKEAKAGGLQMPTKATTLHILSGPEAKFNPETGQVENATLRYVVYIPWATAESSGLPIRPLVPGGPWIMDPGTHKAHIMISPPKELQK